VSWKPRHELDADVPTRLPHTVTWTLPTTQKNTFNEASSAGADTVVFADYPASVEPRDGREYLRGQQVAAEITHIVWVRYLAALTAKCTGTWLPPGQTNTVSLEVVRVLPPKGAPRWMGLLCKQLESP
jgi:head-tail adaptor